MKKEHLKYKLYEEAVQSPEWQVNYLPQYYTWLFGKPPTSMREDFCGTARISCEWVKLSPKNRAVGIDLDPKTLAYAKSVNMAGLTAPQKKQISLLKQDVLKPTKEKFDWIGAYNFSFYTFHERQTLVKYLRAAYQSLNKKGCLFLEMAGGEGFKETISDKKKFKVYGVGMVHSVWEQKQYNPIQQTNQYAIHFKLPDGKWMDDAFTYDWRIWEIRETREILEEAGFKQTIALWEHRDDDADEFLPQDQAPNQRDWLAYVVGVKK